MPVKCIGWLWRARAMLSSNCFVTLSVVVVSYATIARSRASVAAQPVTPTASMATVSGARVSRLPARHIRLHIGPTTTSLVGKCTPGVDAGHPCPRAHMYAEFPQLLDGLLGKVRR